MNLSILVFGGDNFLSKLPKQLSHASTFSVKAITNLNQAISHIQNTPPDVVLVQASEYSSMELCCWLKEQTKLSWIYCILIEDRPPMLALKSQNGKEWELKMTSTALQQGADAYIWQIENCYDTFGQTEKNANEQLLLAHLNVALRKAQTYRDLIKTNDVLSAIALCDPLTELNNRRALELDLPRQIQKARTHGTPLSLIILDVDYFKTVNDTYGHLVGDRVLQLLSHRVRNNLRFQDTPFRYGGEEFVVVLSNTIGDEALIVARRLNRIVSEQPFVINSKLSIHVTISAGASCLRPEDDSKGISLLNRADQHLLAAKVAGRNHVIGCNSYSHHVSSRQTVSSQS